MGLTVRLQNWEGDVREEIYEPHGAPLPLPDPSDEAFRCIGFIDLWGDAVFNCLQMPTLMQELERFEATLSDDDQRRFIREIVALAAECHSSVHLYVKFLGD